MKGSYLKTIGFLGTAGLLAACTALAMQGNGQRPDYTRDFPERLGWSVSAATYFQAGPQRQLAQAAADGDAAAMQAAVDAGAQVDHVGTDAMTPLVWALAKGSAEGMAWLLEHGADPNRILAMPKRWWADWPADKGPLKASPMSLAVQVHDHPELLRVLLDNGGDPNLLLYGPGSSNLLMRCMTGTTPRANVEVLLEYGADPSYRDEHGRTPLHDATYGHEFALVLKMLRAGADPTIDPPGNPSTVVELLAKYGNSGRYAQDRDAYPELVAELQRRGLIPKEWQYDPNAPLQTWDKKLQRAE